MQAVVDRASESVIDAAAQEAFDHVAAGLDELFAAGLVPTGRADAEAWIRLLEAIGRRVDAARVELLAEIHDAGWHRYDGHSSGRAMVELVADLSVRESGARERTRKVVAELPEVASAFRAGQMTAEHLQVLGRLRAKREVRFAMYDRQGWFIEQATTRCFADYETAVLRWARLVDTTNTSRNQQAHETRHFRIRQDRVDLTWDIVGSCAAGQGAMFEQILRAYAAAEYEADWEKARAEHGDEATAAHLPRTAGQRSVDALTQIFTDATANPGSAGASVVHNIVYDAATFEAALAAIEGNRRPAFDVDTFRCETIDGIPVDPVEATISSLVEAARRVVVDASGTVIDLGRARCFTGHARIAAQLQSTTCIWPGCWVAATGCQVDHLREHQHGGRTNPGNGAPLCGRHNRHKHNHRFTVQRGPDGDYAVMRPDGTTI
jgi:hypothetical protein